MSAWVQNPHLNSTGKHCRLLVTLGWSLKLSAPSARKASSRAGSFQATRAPAGPRMPAPGTPGPFAHPGPTVQLQLASLPSPPLWLRLPLCLSPLHPLFLVSLISSLTPISTCWALAMLLPGSVRQPPTSHLLPPLSHLPILVCLYSHLEFPGLAGAQSLNYGHNEKWCIRPATS